MTVVSALMLRPQFRFDMFDDLTATETTPPVPIAGMPSREGRIWTVTFAGDLTPEQVQAIKDRMASTDDADQAERALIRAARAGAATNLLDILAARTVGDPLPAPIYPQ